MEYTLLGISPQNLQHTGGLQTATEISHQPSVWNEIYQTFSSDPALFQKNKEILQKADKIILTGAGTSAFIGESLVGLWCQNINPNTQAIATTHIVSHPESHLLASQNIVLVSFARSGSSPESLAAVALAEKLCKSCYHVVITCNPTGGLVTAVANLPSQVFLLPAAAHDQSLAMTSSYSGMLFLATLMGLKEITETEVTRLVHLGQNILENETEFLKTLADRDFHRVIFLGSGPFFGTAKESHLKVQEMTDGRVICKFDSFLGFRHGPKVIAKADSLVIMFFSNDPYVAQYETDLAKSFENQDIMYKLGVGGSETQGSLVNKNIALDGRLSDQLLAVAVVMIGQILGFYKALALGIKPDNPSATGTITRVVQGVNIYEYPL